MEKQCTYLIFDERVARVEPSELAKDLESPDVKIKIATMKKIIILMLNGEQLGSLLMRVIQYVVPNEVCAPATPEGGFLARAPIFRRLPPCIATMPCAPAAYDHVACIFPRLPTTYAVP
jgi:hypothetical protein